MCSKHKYAVITDVGSTATKAILLDMGSESPTLMAIASHATTVELPQNDVCIGIKKACVRLEERSGIQLLEAGNADNELIFAPDILYLSSSSAGGGLQILVIGLTLFDSASSAQRAAYGAGGVILDTFAINDKRQAAEQMMAMRKLHPDMILLSGGTDGGALSGVLRLAEILRVAKPLPKYETATPIPTLYAGNSEAASLVKKMIGSDFDLHIMPNLRPKMDVENLSPTQDAIRNLFMENVMERAPGYHKLKQITQNSIIPTPLGVLNTLSLFDQKSVRNVFAFDVGGATTDVFSQINGHLQRTVSANLGMSYSALNVFKESTEEGFMNMLAEEMPANVVRNYIGNKCLNPTLQPHTKAEKLIEQVLATLAIRLAFERHEEMHFNKEKLGFLERVKADELDGFDFKFNYQVHEKKYQFQHSDIELIIASGGVFAHIADPLDAAMIIINAIKPKGITEIVIDTDFISPHIGVLSQTDASAASQLLASDSFQSVAWHVAPIFSKRQKKAQLSYEINGKAQKLMPNSIQILPAGQKDISFHLTSNVSLGNSKQSQGIKTSLPVILDSRIIKTNIKTTAAETVFRITEELQEPVFQAPKSYFRELRLPYKGEILASVGQSVQSQDLIAINRYNPPRLFIVDGFSKFGSLSEELIKSSFAINLHDKVDFDDEIAELPDDPKWPMYLRKSRRITSPVRGKVELIDYHTGLVVLSEIQDYSSKPMTVDLASGLGVKPKHAGRYLSKIVGDFVYKGDVLASRKAAGAFRFVKAPQTGNLTHLDSKNGLLTIQYKTSPIDFCAHINGVVSELRPEESIILSYQAKRLEARLGVGKDGSGTLVCIDKADAIQKLDLQGKLLACSFAPSLEFLHSLKKLKIAGLVCSNIQEKTLCDFIGFELGVINTGNESLEFPILILHTFSDEAMSVSLWKELLKQEGKHAYLAPHTRIRAGVVRPFLDCQA